MKNEKRMKAFVLIVAISLIVFMSGCTAILTGCPERWLAEPSPDGKANKTINNEQAAVKEFRNFLFSLTEKKYWYVVENITINDIKFEEIKNVRIRGESINTSRNIFAWVLDKKDIAKLAIDENGTIYSRGTCL